MSKLCGHFLRSALGFPEFSEILEAAGFSALFLFATGSLHPREGSMIQKIPQHLILLCCDRFRHAVIHQPAKVYIFQLHLRTRRFVKSRISSRPVCWFPRSNEFSRSEDVISFCADEELAGTCEDRFIAVSLDFATIISASFCSCTLFAIFLVQLSELKFLAQQVELKWLMLNR